jgi:lipopolysaccharide/colanic/teichoic acid biosynthesis glycosyltransferase
MDATTKIPAAAAGAVPAAPEADRATSRFSAVACRALDIIVAVVLLIVLVPLFLVIAVAIRLDSPGWVVFRQRRVGHLQRPFTVNKFRTMRRDAGHEHHRAFVLGLIEGERPGPDGEKPFFKLTGDARVTRVGRFLRKSSLDELPQLWNVLRGDMSLVGPRPPIGYEVDHYPAHWFGRFAVKPGLTGLWQVSGRSQLTLEQMIALDLDYARRRSLWLNVKILARTIPAVLNGRAAA